jgi:RNA polymerase sigma-70 factor, ECF subfamily
VKTVIAVIYFASDCIFPHVPSFWMYKRPTVSTTTLTIPDVTEDLHFVQLAQKDPREFKALYEKYFKRIFVFIHHRVNDKALTADITSQVFLKAMTNLGKYRHQGVPFSAWLFRIAINECYDFFRKSKRERFVSIEDNGLGELYDQLAADTATEDLLAKLPEILEKLREEDLYVLELRFFEHRPFKELGDILGISETHAKVKVYRALEKARKLFLISPAQPK